jgi:hypothetical protein
MITMFFTACFILHLRVQQLSCTLLRKYDEGTEQRVTDPQYTHKY